MRREQIKMRRMSKMMKKRMRWMKREDEMDEEEVVVVEIEAGHPLNSS